MSQCKPYVLGIDIGGTSIKGGAINSKGNVLDSFKMKVVKGYRRYFERNGTQAPCSWGSFWRGRYISYTHLA